MALNAIPSDPNADSFLTLAEAEAYHTARLYNAEWTAATDATKETALKWATRLLDERYEWYGTVVTYEQALGWPRVGVWYDSRLLSHLEVPTVIKNATAEFALFLIKSDRSVVSEPSEQGLDSLTVGPITLNFNEEDRPDTVPDSVNTICEILSKNKAGMAVLGRM